MNAAETVVLISEDGMKGINDVFDNVIDFVKTTEENSFGLPEMFDSFKSDLEKDFDTYEDAIDWLQNTLNEIGDSPERIKDASYDEGIVLGFRYTIAALDERQNNPMLGIMPIPMVLEVSREKLVEERSL